VTSGTVMALALALDGTVVLLFFHVNILS
jgi:hypothetical protein